MTISKPDVTISLLPASLAVRPEPFKVLIVGQMLTGTAISGTLVQTLMRTLTGILYLVLAQCWLGLAESLEKSTKNQN